MTPDEREDTMTEQTEQEQWRAEFRREVQDKLSVASHCGSGGRAHKEIVMRQCEDFLVEQAEELVAAQVRERDAQIARLTAQVKEQGDRIAVLLRVCPNCAGSMEPENPDSGLRGVYCPECRESDTSLRAEVDTLRAERDALAAAVCPNGGLAGKDLVPLAEAHRVDSECVDEYLSTVDETNLSAAYQTRAQAIRAERDAAQQEIATLKAELVEADADNHRMWTKLEAAKVACACELDRTGDVCMVHVPAVQAQKQRADRLEQQIATLTAALKQARQDFGMVACDGSTAGFAVRRVDAALSTRPQEQP